MAATKLPSLSVSRRAFGSSYAFVLLFISFSQTGCLNPFAPRLDTEAPSQSCSDFTKIDNLLCTFRNAYAFKDTLLYGSLLANEFTFTFRDYEKGVDVSWGRTDEMRTTYALFQSVQSLSLIWNNEISSTGDDTLRSIIRSFNLTVVFNPSDITRVDGYANLTFRREEPSGSWRLIRWRDESNF